MFTATIVDLWAHAGRQKALGGVVIIRYADNVLIGFQHEGEAKAFLHDLRERMGKFDLALHPTRTRLIRFGHHAVIPLKSRLLRNAFHAALAMYLRTVSLPWVTDLRPVSCITKCDRAVARLLLLFKCSLSGHIHPPMLQGQF